jgi:hypothetical protein
LRQLGKAILYDWELAGRRLKLWKPVGESYEHVLMKALGYAMFVGEYPALEVERAVGLRYKPDLVVEGGVLGGFPFWGECGSVTGRKILWLLKHGRVERLVVFKMGTGVAERLADELRVSLPARYRTPSRVSVVGFDEKEVVERTAGRRITLVPPDWYVAFEA